MNDITVIRGYALACKRIADEKLEALDNLIDVMAECERAYSAAQDLANEKLVECNRAFEYAERLAVFAAQAMAGDVAPELVSDAAAAIRGLVPETGEGRAA